MNAVIDSVRHFVRNEEGAELVEWIVFVSLLVIGIGAAVIAMRDTINAGYDNIRSCVANVASC